MTKLNKYTSNHYENFFDNILSKSDPELYNSINILTENQDFNWVYWKEGYYHSKGTKSDQLQLSLHASMIDISELLSDKLYNRKSKF